MKEKIFILLDELVSMSESSFTTESLNLELNEIDKRIAKCRNSIKRFEDGFDDSKYFDISSQMVDRNLEVNLNKRIKKLEEETENLESLLQETLNKEKENHMELERVSGEINDASKLIKVLEQKSKNLKNEESEKIYKELIDDAKASLNKREDKKENVLFEKTEIEGELKSLSETKEELRKQLEDENQKLKDTQKVLSNEKNYYDYKAKKEDEEYLSGIHSQIDELEKSRLELLTDPAYLAGEVKQLVVENDMTNAISKIKELVSVIEQTPEIKEEDVNKLKEKEASLKEKIDSKKSEIESNAYPTQENDVLVSRAGYLNNLVQELTEKTNALKKCTEDIDNKIIIDLKLEINHAELSKKKLEENIHELEQLNAKNNSVNVLSSIMAYQRELDSINKVINKEIEDLEYLVNLSCMLDNNITNMEKKISEKNIEIGNNEREISLKSKLIDEKAKLEDEKELAKLEKQLGYVEHRLKYKRTPQDIYNEIDCLLSSLDFDEPKKRAYTSRVEKARSKNRLKVLEVEDPENKDVNPKEQDTEFISPINEDNSEKEPTVSFDEILSSIGDQ